MSSPGSHPPQPEAHVLVSQGLKLNYFQWGDPAAPALLLVHGMRDHARSWDWTARALAADWRVIAPDLRGHGDSDWSPDGAYLASYHVLDIVNLVESLGPEPVTIVAHSYGGHVCARYASAFPERVRKLALVEGLGPTPKVIVEWAQKGPAARTREWLDRRRPAARQAQRRMKTLDEAAQRMKAANPHLTPDQAMHLARHGVREHADGLAWKYDPRVGVFPPEEFALDGAAIWREIACPALLFYGAESWTGDPEVDGRAANIRDRRSLVFEGAGHWLHHDDPERFVAELRAFL